MSKIEAYRKLCLTEPTIPIFSRSWWLDAVCENAWDVCLVEKSGRIVAAMPFHASTTKFGFRLLTQPPETQTLGPWLRASNAKIANRLSQEKDLLKELIEQLPDFDYFQQNWHHANQNWLPFFWRGFEQTTRYTYRLPDLADLDSIWDGFQGKIRGDIRKAQNRFKVTVRRDGSLDDFYALNVKVYRRQGIPVPYSRAFVGRLDNACNENDARRIFVAEDSEGRQHAAVYLVWDEQSAYYLMGGSDPEFRASGSTSLCLWDAIQFAASVTRSFDFEGSMLEPVERYFRAFGAIQTPYFSVSKVPSRLLRFRKAVAAALKR